jgi:hypothetical protein
MKSMTFDETLENELSTQADAKRYDFRWFDVEHRKDLSCSRPPCDLTYPTSSVCLIYNFWMVIKDEVHDFR